MKYTIEGFSQQVQLDLSIDVVDLCILRWFVDFQATGKMELLQKDGKAYYWVNYGYLIDQMPGLYINNRDIIGRRFKKLVKAGVLRMTTKRLATGTKAFFSTATETFEKMLSQDSHPTEKSGSQPTQKSAGHPTEKSGNSSIMVIPLSDSSTNSAEDGQKDDFVNSLNGDKDLYHRIEQAFIKKSGDFTDWGKEGRAIKGIIDKAKRRLPEDPTSFAGQMINKFWKLRQEKSFYAEQPFIPSALNSAGIWDRVLETFREEQPNDDPEYRAAQAAQYAWELKHAGVTIDA